MSWPTLKATSSACSGPASTHCDAHRSRLSIRYVLSLAVTAGQCGDSPQTYRSVERGSARAKVRDWQAVVGA